MNELFVILVESAIKTAWFFCMMLIWEKFMKSDKR